MSTYSTAPSSDTTCSVATCSAATVLRRHRWGARSASAPATRSTKWRAAATTLARPASGRRPSASTTRMELRFAFLVNIRRDQYILDEKKKKKFQGGFNYPLPMDCNWSFRQFGEVICSPYPWGLHVEVEFRYYDGGTEWVKVSNDAELATMFAKHKEKGQFHNLQRACHAENQDQDEADIDASVIDDEEGEDEDLPPVQWDPENPQMEEGSIFASMSECRNALVTYCIKAERTFEVDKSDTVRYRVHCPTNDCPWRMHASKMRNSTNIQVKVNPFRHTCLESTLRKETISRAKSRWVAEEVKRWVTENHQVGTKELQKNLKEKFKIELPYMRVFNGKQHAMESIYVAYSVLEAESEEIWTWFLQNLRRAIAHPNGLPHDFANDPNDDSDNDQIEAPNDDQIDYQSDQNVEQNDAPIEAPNNGDQNDEQNDAPIEAPKDGDQNVQQNDAPTEALNDACSVVGSNKVVAVSSEVLEVLTTKRRRVVEKSTRSTRSKVVATSTRITRSKVVARSIRIKKKPLRFGDD
ncbi:hypothetical protein ACQ4PT_030155 [Festuca glaucescens]